MCGTGWDGGRRNCDIDVNPLFGNFVADSPLKTQIELAHRLEIEVQLKSGK